MSCPDPLHDYEDFNMDIDSNYDDHDDFYGESADYSDYNDDRDFEDEEVYEMDGEECGHEDGYDDSMDGDHDSAMESAGWGTDEDYGYYDDGREDFHSDDAVGFVDYGEDGPYEDY